MLPLPGAPSSSWPMYKARLRAVFEGTNPRSFLAFWLFGMDTTPFVFYLQHLR